MCKVHCWTDGWYVITPVMNVDHLFQLPQNRHRFGKQALYRYICRKGMWLSFKWGDKQGVWNTEGAKDGRCIIVNPHSIHPHSTIFFRSLGRCICKWTKDPESSLFERGNKHVRQKIQALSRRLTSEEVSVVQRLCEIMCEELKSMVPKNTDDLLFIGETWYKTCFLLQLSAMGEWRGKEMWALPCFLGCIQVLHESAKQRQSRWRSERIF